MLGNPPPRYRPIDCSRVYRQISDEPCKTACVCIVAIMILGLIIIGIITELREDDRVDDDDQSKFVTLLTFIKSRFRS